MSNFIDLNAARREATHPDQIDVAFGDSSFKLPAELPLDALDPFLDPQLDLVGLIRQFLEASEKSDAEATGGESTDEEIGDLVIRILSERPTLLHELLGTIHATFEVLFGAEQYVAFRAERPSIPDYLRLMRGLIQMYGVSLGEAFASPASSESAGATQKPTSPSTSRSTRARAGAAQVTSAAS